MDYAALRAQLEAADGHVGEMNPYSVGALLADSLQAIEALEAKFVEVVDKYVDTVEKRSANVDEIIELRAKVAALEKDRDALIGEIKAALLKGFAFHSYGGPLAGAVVTEVVKRHDAAMAREGGS